MRVFTSVCCRRDETEGVASVLAYLFMLKRMYVREVLMHFWYMCTMLCRRNDAQRKRVRNWNE